MDKPATAPDDWEREPRPGQEPVSATGSMNEQLQAEVLHRRRVEEELRQSLEQAERSRRAMLGTLEDVVHAERQASLRASQQAAIAELGQLALAGTELPVLLDQAVCRLAEVLQVELCKVLELQPDGANLWLRAGVGWDEGLVGRTILGAGPESQGGFTLQRREPVIVEDLRTETRFSGPSLLLDHNVISGASVIIGDLKHPYGVLGVHTTQRRTFSSQDVHFLQGVANLLAEAVQRRWQQAEIERLNRLYATVSQVNQAIVRCRSRQDICQEVCRIVVEFGRFTAAWIGWQEADTGQLTRLAHCTSPVHRELVLPGWLGPCGVIAEALQTGRPTLCQDSNFDLRAAACREVLDALGVRSCAAFPLRMGGRLCGVFTICSIEPSFFCGEEIRLLEEVAGDVSFALDKLFEEQQRRQAEESLRRQTAVTEAINRVLLQTLVCETDAEVARTCLAVAIELTGSQYGWIGEVNADGKLDSIALSAPGGRSATPSGDPAGMIKGLELRGIFGHVFRNGQSVVSNEFASQPDCFGTPPGHPELSAFLGVPLKDGNRTMGIIALANKDGGYEPHDQAAVETLSVALVAVMKRKRAEAERRRLMIAIEQAGESIVVTDPQGTIEYVNPAFEAATGYCRLVAVGQNPRILKSGKQDDAFYRQVWETISGGRTWQGRMVNRRRDGTLYTEEATISPVRDAAGRVVSYVAIKRDISEQLRDAEEKSRLAEQLRQAQRVEAVGRLAGGVAHDFNNMLGVILGYAQIILNGLNPQDPLCDSVREIISAGERSANLTRQLLAFSRRQTLRPVALNLNAVIWDLQGLLRRLIGEDVRIELQLAEGLAAVLADPGQIEQVIMNLAVNARDAMPQGGTLTVETAPGEWPAGASPAAAGLAPGTYVLLGLTDTGTGMDRETMAHIFEPFFTTKEIGKGTGLGLATVYGIVKQSGGGILVDSEPGQGTRFRIYLPTATRSAETREFPTGQPGTQRGRESILIVEDEPALRELVENVLRGLGYRVYAAANGEEAVRLVEQFGLEPELLLTDVVMPGMSGAQLVERLRHARPGLRVLYMSGYTDDTLTRHLALDSGVPFIQKPFSAPALSEKVREAFCGGPG